MVRNWFCIFIAGAATILIFPIACLAMVVTLDRGASIWVARRLWSPILLWAGGAKLIVEGREHVDPSRPTVYCSNHQSTIDIPTLFMALPVNFRYLAKQQLRYVPFIGWYLWLAGHIFIDRSNHRRARASLDAAAARIRAGTSLIVYAEGTRSEDGRVLPFKKGSFVLAIKAGVPVCPVTIEGSAKLMPKNRWTITPGPIRVKIGAPIDSRAYTEAEREKLARKVREVVIAQSLEMGGPGGSLGRTTTDAEDLDSEEAAVN
jgi:1-acyl-sn-glycerol-3-phosphate acyltransferase